METLLELSAIATLIILGGVAMGSLLRQHKLQAQLERMRRKVNDPRRRGGQIELDRDIKRWRKDKKWRKNARLAIIEFGRTMPSPTTTFQEWQIIGVARELGIKIGPDGENYSIAVRHLEQEGFLRQMGHQPLAYAPTSSGGINPMSGMTEPAYQFILPLPEA